MGRVMSRHGMTKSVLHAASSMMMLSTGSSGVARSAAELNTVDAHCALCCTSSTSAMIAETAAARPAEQRCSSEVVGEVGRG